ncbi:MAG: aldo/keto reductase [Pseudomonadota bacterium]|nr:aldo/keto reductase [Pseudomonadota bacterium]
MQYSNLGLGGSLVSEVGLGCMGMSDFYGPADRTTSIATLHAALDAGITLLDTGDFYGMGHNEMLLAEALKGRRDKVFLGVKFGPLRGPEGGWYGMGTTPPLVKTFLNYSLKRLGTDYIDLYQPARLDPRIPIEETVGAIAEMVKAGFVRHIGLSEVGPETIRKAHAIHPICAVQLEYSLIERGIERQLLATCRELGIAITVYGVLSRGLLSGKIRTVPSDGRAMMPRFHDANLSQNLRIVDAIATIGAKRGATCAQIAMAWVKSRGNDIFPLIGARTRDQLNESLGAMDLLLTAEDLALIEAAAPVGAAAGTRYDSRQMAMLDSER